MSCPKKKITQVFIGLCILILLSASLYATPVDITQVENLVSGWLSASEKPLSANMGRYLNYIEIFTDPNDQPIYYVVYLKPSGFLVVSADDLIEPIIAFSSGTDYGQSPDDTLAMMVNRDLPQRTRIVRLFEKSIMSKPLDTLTEVPSGLQKQFSKAKDKWQRWQKKTPRKITNTVDSFQPETFGSILNMSVSPQAALSDERVPPLVQSQWSQLKVAKDYCYNYYTPNHYPSGCVATAMAQLMRYHRYPSTGIGQNQYTIWIDDHRTTRTTRGGDGSGGPYKWNRMPFVPDHDMTQAQRKAIGALCYDAGVAANMEYSSEWSGASMDNARDALLITFGYSEAVLGWNGWKHIGSGLNGMINPNLDAGFPVLMSVDDNENGSGHALICDGYGYEDSTLYHHLNFGWSGNYDAWYNLPDIVTAYDFSLVDICIYNIFTKGSGEIISGRITDTSGSPVSNAIVSTRIKPGTYRSSTTDSRGIYALAKIPSDSTYIVRVQDPNSTYFHRKVVVGKSIFNQKVSGNRWAVDFLKIADDFDDNCVASIWKTYQSDPNCRLEEMDQRLELLSFGTDENLRTTNYCSNGWRLDASKDFGIKIDYFYDPNTIVNAAGLSIGLRTETGEYVKISADRDEDNHYFSYSDSDMLEPDLVAATKSNGTLYISYDASVDTLYLGNSGYNDSNSIWTCQDLLQGTWQGNPLLVEIGGNVVNTELNCGQVFLDNFIVSSGAIIEKVVLTTPEAQSQWARGNPYKLRWTTDNPSLNVKILLYKSGSQVAVLKASTANDGVWKWSIPDDLPLGTDYQIKVVCLDDSSVFGLSDFFEILRPGDLYTPIQVSDPNGSTVWEMGSKYPIKWTGGNGPEPDMGTEVKIKLYKGKNIVKTIKASTPNDGTAVWRVPYDIPVGTNYRVKVISTDYNYVKGASQKFEITAPPLYVTQPNGGETWKSATNHKIKWARGPGADHVKIQLLNSDGTVKSLLTQSTPDDGVWTWKIPISLEPGQYKVRVASLDTTGRRDVSDAVFNVVYNYNRTSYMLEEFRRYDVRGEHWDYEGPATVQITGLGYPYDDYETYYSYPSVEVSPTYRWINGYKCNVVMTSDDETNAKMAWFTDASGNHLEQWVINMPLGKMTFDMKSVVVAPESLRIGTLYTNSGPISGTINGTIYEYGTSYPFTGTIKGRSNVSTELIGWRNNKTVPYGTYKAMKIVTKIAIENATMTIKVEGQSARFNLSVEGTETFFGVPHLGIIKTKTNLVERLSYAGDTAVIKATGELELTDYYNTRD